MCTRCVPALPALCWLAAVEDRAVTQGCACSLAQYGHLTASCTAGVACPQALQAEVNGGQFHDAALCNRQQPQPPLAAGGADAPAAGSRRSFASLLALAATRQQQAAPLLAVLLEAGADPNAADLFGFTPLHIAGMQLTSMSLSHTRGIPY